LLLVLATFEFRLISCLSKTWVQLVSTLERVGNQVHYISPSVAGPELRDRQHYTAEPKWYSEKIDVTFQFDGNYKQQAYRVWLDGLTLNAY